MGDEDPGGTQIASILCQDEVVPTYSGALIQSDGGPIIEGVAGTGDGFMLGTSAPEQLPERVIEDVATLHRKAVAVLGNVRIEWVHDGTTAWVVQVNSVSGERSIDVITKLDAAHWIEFDVVAGLAALRELVRTLAPDTGIRLSGKIGRTSHMVELLIQTNVPARM
jgi:hypothetical protein